MQKIINFIKYNNGFMIILGIVFLGAGSSFASEKVRDAVIGQTIEEVKGMDNSALLSTDLNSLKQEMSIGDVSEDEDNYLISYTFSTFDIKDNIWQNQTKTQTLKVPKEALNGGKDLGLYVQSELAQVMDTQLAYLKDAQEREQKKGQTKIIKTTKYTGLKGLVLNSETKELEGYTPVMEKEERVEPAYVAPVATAVISHVVNGAGSQVESSSQSSSETSAGQVSSEQTSSTSSESSESSSSSAESSSSSEASSLQSSSETAARQASSSSETASSSSSSESASSSSLPAGEAGSSSEASSESSVSSESSEANSEESSSSSAESSSSVAI